MRNILYTKHFDEEINENVNVILSPQYYWIKKVDIPVKSLSEAKKIAPSILKLKPKEFFFSSIKFNNQIFVIAIKKDLKLKIDKKYIKSIKIAQCEFNDYECINLPNNYSLQKINGMFFCFPNHKDECICIDNLLEKISLSSYEFNYFNSLNISKSNLFLIFSAFILLIISFITKGIIYKTQLNKINDKYTELTKFNLPLNSYQLDSLIFSLETKVKYNQKIRDILKAVQKISLKENEYIEKINLDNNKIEVSIFSKRNFDTYFNKFHFKSFRLKNLYKVIIDVK